MLSVQVIIRRGGRMISVMEKAGVRLHHKATHLHKSHREEALVIQNVQFSDFSFSRKGNLSHCANISTF